MFVNVQECCAPQAKLQEGSTFDGRVLAVGWRGLKLIQEALSGVGTAQFKLHLLRKAIWERKCKREKAG